MAQATGGHVWNPAHQKSALNGFTPASAPASTTKMFESKADYIVVGGAVLWVVDVVFFFIYVCHWVFQTHITTHKTPELFSVITQTGNIPMWPIFASGFAALLTLSLIISYLVEDDLEDRIPFAIMIFIIAGIVLTMATLLISITNAPAHSSTSQAKTWIQEQAGTKTIVPNSFDLDQTYSYHLYGDTKAEWIASVKVNGDKATVTLEPVKK